MVEKCLWCGDIFSVIATSDSDKSKLNFYIELQKVLRHELECKRKFWERR